MNKNIILTVIMFGLFGMLLIIAGIVGILDGEGVMVVFVFLGILLQIACVDFYYDMKDWEQKCQK